MRVVYTRGALGLALWALVAVPAFAQHEDHQTPGAGTPASPSSCAQSSQGVTRNIDAASGRIDEVRQTNDAAKMRAAVADLQVTLAQMKTQLADCTALTQTGSGATGSTPGMNSSKMQMAPGTAVVPPGSTVPVAEAKTTPSMPGMDHSKMPMTAKAPIASKLGTSTPKAKAGPSGSGMDHSKMAVEKPAPAAAEGSPKTAQTTAVVFTLRTQPAPARRGKNDFEVTVKDADGKPMVDAEVSLAFYLPAMPSMNMPEMRNSVKLTSAGNGSYKGSGTIGMAGDWDVTVTASRGGQQLDVKKMKLTAK